MIALTWPQYRRREVTYQGETVHLRPQEMEFLSMLLMRRGQIVSGEEMIENLWPDPDREPEMPRYIMSRLRCNLEQKMPGLVTTVWGRGWVIH